MEPSAKEDVATEISAPAKKSKSKDPDGYKEADFEPKDWALQLLLDTTVDLSPTNSIGLSVISNGLLLSGIAINRDKWRELFVAQIAGAGSEGSTEYLASALDKVIANSFEKFNELLERRRTAELQEPATHFLHFRDVRVHSAQPSDYPLFRVAVHDISAWSLGSHNQVESPKT